MTRPTVVFVCVRNAGKSQLAAALARRRAGDRLDVRSAGTRPGPALNPEVVAALAEVGVGPGDEHPKPVDPDLVARADRVVLLGAEVHLDAPAGVPVERWETDEPSLRGVTGMERMRLVRDDVAAHVGRLLDELGVPDDAARG